MGGSLSSEAHGGSLGGDHADPAVKFGLWFAPILALIYLTGACWVVKEFDRSTLKARFARRVFFPIATLAFVGYLAHFFAWMSQGFVFVDTWDAGAAATASARLPRRMRHPSHAPTVYADSYVRYGLYSIVCVGADGGGDDQRKKLACASDHVFSPVTPPEPQPRHGLGVRKFFNLTIADKLCGRQPGTGDDDRDSFSRKFAPKRAAFYGGGEARAQKRALSAVCGGGFRAAKALLGYAAAPALFYGMVLAPALAGCGSAGGYVAFALLCASTGACAWVARGLVRDWAEVLDDAYPYRRVGPGWASDALFWGCVLEFVAAGAALAAACVLRLPPYGAYGGGDDSSATADDRPFRGDDATFRPIQPVAGSHYEMAPVVATAEVLAPGSSAAEGAFLVGTVVAAEPTVGI